MHDKSFAEIQVWDPFIRIAHWTVGLGFFVAYLTEDVTTVHVWAGYIVGVLVLARILWGLAGPRHARFADFVTDPITAIRYLWDLLHARAKRYVGHSPAGGAMVIALLVFLAATVVTGLIRYAGESAVGEAHEVIANITLGLVVFHVLGVLLASFVHHENLAKAMITGRKRPD